MKREQSSDGELLRYALKYAGWGLRVLPLHSLHEGKCSCWRSTCASAGKHPRTKNGVKDATTERGQIQSWWKAWPDANVGIATGVYGERGLYVIDLDMDKGADFESLRDCDLETLFCSRIARTGSGGYHIYLRCSQRLPNTANRLGPFIDTRGEGGYVVAPPSRNANGPYVWEADLNRILPAPPALLARLECVETTKTSTFNQKMEKEHEISDTTHTDSTPDEAHGHYSDPAPAAPTASVPPPGGPVSQKKEQPRDLLAASQDVSGWQARPRGVYYLQSGEHQVCLVPEPLVPGRYRCLARLAPDFQDECWFNNSPLAWAKERAEARLRQQK